MGVLLPYALSLLKFVNTVTEEVEIMMTQVRIEVK